MRETVRLATLDVAALYAQHARAFEAGGAGAFAVGALLNGSLIGWCLWQASRPARHQNASTSTPTSPQGAA